MNKKHKMIILLGLIASAFFISEFIRHASSWAVLNPQGLIAHQQRNLLVFTVMLSLIVVIPVFVMTFVIAWKYREGNAGAKYSPEWDKNALAETIWWGVPLVLIFILAGVTIKSSHQLDPFKPLVSNTPTMTIQVVALDWKWLFIYPQQQIATVNYVRFPQKTPIKFEITADAPMNSFWIPQLGGQIYAMSGMSTHLNLIADSLGYYRGSSANISGRGFAGMNFTAHSTSEADFNQWVKLVRQSGENLSLQKYTKLAKQSQNNPVHVYAKADPHLYDTIVMKYMLPTGNTDESNNMDMP